MALLIDFDGNDPLGDGPLYWRLNNIEQHTNRQPDGAGPVPTIARFHAYRSEAHFRAGKPRLEGRDLLVEFFPPSANEPIVSAAYSALKEMDPSMATASKLAERQAERTRADQAIEAAKRELAKAKALPPDEPDVEGEPPKAKRKIVIGDAEAALAARKEDRAQVQEAVKLAEADHAAAKAKRAALEAATDV